MANRYLISDMSKRIGRTHIGKRSISHFIFEAPEGSPVAKLRSAYAAALDADAALRESRANAEASKKFTALGISEQVAESALTDALPKLRRARVAVERIKAEMAERASKLTPKLPDPADLRGEAQRAEIRAMLRNMPEAQREEYVQQNRANPVILAAIVHAPAALSGLHEMKHAHIINEQIAREHGEEIAELRDLEEVVRVVDKLTAEARAEAQAVIGCSDQIFASIADMAEANDGKLPFRIETQVVDGKTLEVCKVYDFEARRWRDAKPEEISTTGRAA